LISIALKAGFRRWWTLPVGVALLGLAACSGGSGGGSQQPRASLEYPATDYFEQAPGTPGGKLRVSVQADTGQLDLHAISHTNAQWLGRLIFDNLVYLDDKGAITPWLAKSWTISPDGKTYTFHLRDDVTFSDGAKFNAEAVRINLEHMRDPATKSPLAAAYIAPYVDGRVVDEYTFEARLREPYAPFLNVLAQSWLSMQSPKAILERPKEIGQKPVGSGPFVVESYTRQQGIQLVRRKDYHWAPDFIRHKGPAYLDRIEIVFVPEAMTRHAGLTSGEFQLTIDAPLQNAAAIRADPRLVLDNRVRTGITTTGLTFNTEQPPFDDPRVRQALAKSVDRESLARAIRFGEVRVKSDLLASNTRYYDPSAAGVLAYDVAAAGALLDAAGWTGRDAAGFRTKDGKRLAAEVVMTDAGFQTPTVVAVQSDLKRVGMDLKIVQLPQAQVTERRLANQYQALGLGVWHTNTPDALYILYHSNEISSDKRIGQNSARLRDPVLDDLLARARRTSDQAEAQLLYSQAQKRLSELAPAIPLFENHSVVAYSRDLKGLTFDTSHNTPVFTTAWLGKGGQ
jgi:peptide/nickel transport system substrate-binding protein